MTVAIAVVEAERPRRVGLAYRLLGSMTDAEDVVQDAWLRWETSPAEIDRPEAWLTTVVTRLAIDRLRSAQHQRETYVGPWLPEPVAEELGPAEAAELADSMTLGFLTVLERLEPVERAVFLLADVFDEPFSEIARIVGRSPAACRQIASRARRRVRDPQRRAADESIVVAEQRRVASAFVAATAAGDVDALLGLLAPDVVLVSDGGADRHAARRPVVGPERVARLLTNIARRMPRTMAVEVLMVNHEPGIVLSFGGQPFMVVVVHVEGGKVSAVNTILNPDKLGHLRPVLDGGGPM